MPGIQPITAKLALTKNKKMLFKLPANDRFGHPLPFVTKWMGISLHLYQILYILNEGLV